MFGNEITRQMFWHHATRVGISLGVIVGGSAASLAILFNLPF